MSRYNKLNSEQRIKVLNYLRSLPAKECEELLNYIFVMKDPETREEITLKMHKALVYKIQRRLDKQIVDLCNIKTIACLREYLDRAFYKVNEFLEKQHLI